MTILIGLGFMGFGYLMYKMYRGYTFHHSIGIPIIILGSLTILGAIGIKIADTRSQDFSDLTSNEIEKIRIENAFHRKRNMNEYYGIIIDDPLLIERILDVVKRGERCEYESGDLVWYMSLEFKLISGESLYATFTYTGNGYIFNRTIKFIGRVDSDEFYRVENIFEGLNMILD